ncbi:VanW family protein [Gorillibacterium timonense]|uniref:VanW family protein n=1 Tax=Gorillibacterium timonense TaxID=1689269 RepID=UPI00071C78BF|nr:VanW family protein [Gorillibacterium timonense]
MKQALLKHFPILYNLRVNQLRMTRRLSDHSPAITFASSRKPEAYPYTCKKHQSLLRRRLGSSDPQLQENKVTNLKLAVATMDGILIRPGETFSFWKLVGKPTADKGYIEGLLLSQGEVKTGVGGGLCQLANLLYWMALHSPLEVIERHHHSFDPFPDDHRVLPFGSGASVFFNYIDLRFYNPTSSTFQVKLWLTDRHLKGSLSSEEEWPLCYHVEERNHRFLRKNGRNYRQNEIWRTVVDRKTGWTTKEEKLISNFAEVKYELPVENPDLEGEISLPQQPIQSQD